MQSAYNQYIEVDPEVRFGKPVVKGTRIAVSDVLQWLASGMSHAEIIEDFPQLTQQQICACALYSGIKPNV